MLGKSTNYSGAAYLPLDNDMVDIEALMNTPLRRRRHVATYNNRGLNRRLCATITALVIALTLVLLFAFKVI